MEEFPNVTLDLCPGGEQYPAASLVPTRWHDFFMRYQKRIVFGTDLCDLEPWEGEAGFQRIRRSIETDDAFDFFAQKLHGVGPLPAGALDAIYHGNLQRLVGLKPRSVDILGLASYCHRLMSEVEGTPSKTKHTAELRYVLGRLTA